MSNQGVFGKAKEVSGKNEIHASFLKICHKCGFSGGVGEKSDICIKCQDLQEEKQIISV